MSTYFRPRCEFNLKDIASVNKSLSMEHDEENEDVPLPERDKLETIWVCFDHKGSNLLYRNGSYLHFDFNQLGNITDVFRYGGSDADDILEPIESHTGVSFVDEHEDEYMELADDETNVVSISLPISEMAKVFTSESEEDQEETK